jgi:hypothetical protein
VVIAALLSGIAASPWMRAAERLARLPRGWVIGETLSDYAVMWEQARLCSRP